MKGIYRPFNARMVVLSILSSTVMHLLIYFFPDYSYPFSSNSSPFFLLFYLSFFLFVIVSCLCVRKRPSKTQIILI